MAVNKNISMYECNNVVDVGGTYTCSLEEIDTLIEQVSNLHFIFISVISDVRIIFVFLILGYLENC